MPAVFPHICRNPRRDRMSRLRPAHTLIAALALAATACQTATTTTRPATPAPVFSGPRVVPAPASLVVGNGAPFEVTRATVILVANNPEVRAIGEMLAALIRPPTGFPIGVVGDSANPVSAIRLGLAADRAA